MNGSRTLQPGRPEARLPELDVSRNHRASHLHVFTFTDPAFTGVDRVVTAPHGMGCLARKAVPPYGVFVGRLGSKLAGGLRRYRPSPALVSKQW